ncbi:MAG: thymidylate synthase [Vulcanisaeta sp.]|nr:thymidylate synthase [Vulcanisaeta sp.]
MRLRYEVINEESNIAVVTLWSSVEQVKKVLGDALSMVGVIGNLYTAIGINYMLSTLARMNRIDTLIMVGADVNGVGDLVVRFFRDGYLPRPLISREVLDMLRSSIRLLDLREAYRSGRFGEVIEALRSNYNPSPPKRPAIYVEVVEEEVNNWPFPLAGAFIYERDTYRSWVRVVDLVLNYGFDKVVGDGASIREFLMPLVVIDSIGRPHPFRRLNENGLRAFSDVNRAIGDKIINELRGNPYSLNAVVIEGDYVVQGILSGDYYNQFVYLRSVDVLNDWCRNVYRWWSLAKYVVDELNREFNAWYSVGYVGILPFTAWIRGDDLRRAEEFVRRNASVFREFVEDPRGSFVIRREGDGVIIEHRLPMTHDLHRRLTFKSLNEAYEYFKNSNYFTTYAHALYLGKEVARAFLLSNYEQDSN